MLAKILISIRLALFTIFVGVFLLGCSSGGNHTPPVLPDNPSSTTESTGNSVSREINTHHLLSYNLIQIDATDPNDVKAEIIPARIGSMHLNILKLLEVGPCTNCFEVVDLNIPQPGVLDVEILIRHPFTDKDFTVFDVRGIMMFNGSHVFPDSGLTISDSSMGDGELLNADGYTALYNGSTMGMAGDFFTYYQGKFATPTIPNADLNGFIRHYTSTERNMFAAGGSDTRTYTLKMPTAGEFALGYAVDASWDVPDVDPVTDPLTDFPETANCLEPWKIEVTEWPIGDGLTPECGQTRLYIDVYDWQGSTTLLEPVVECPELFSGLVVASYNSTGDGYTKYKAVFGNELNAQEGQYTVLIRVEGIENLTSPDHLDLTAYTIFYAHVSPGNCNGNLVWAKEVSGMKWCDGRAITTLSDDSTVVTGFLFAPAWGGETFGEGEPNETAIIAKTPDIFIARYNPDGTLAWVKRAGQENCMLWYTCLDSGYGVTSLSDDSTVITGYFFTNTKFGEGEPNETVLDFGGAFIARYNHDGTLAWAKRAGADVGYGITSFSDDSTVITGYFSSTTTFGSGEPNETVLKSDGWGDIFVARYNPDGTLEWAKRAGGTSSDRGYGITTLSDNSTVVTGLFSETATFGEGEPYENVLVSDGYDDIFIAKYNPDGTLTWAKRAGGVSLYSSENEIGHGITTLSDDSIVVTGIFYGSATFGKGEPGETVLVSYGDSDIFMARYNPDGTLAWAKHAGGSSYDFSKGITTLSDNSTVVTGHFYESATFGEGEPNENTLYSDGSNDLFIARYYQDGTLAWVKNARGPGFEVGYGITTLSDDSTVATGIFSKWIIFGEGELHETAFGCLGDNDMFVARFEY